MRAASAALPSLSVPETSTLNGALILTRLSPSEKVPTSPVQGESESQATVPVTEPVVLVKLEVRLEKNGLGSAVKLKLVIEEADAFVPATNKMNARRTGDFFILVSELGEARSSRLRYSICASRARPLFLSGDFSHDAPD